MSEVMIGCVSTQNVLFCFPEPDDIPRNVSKDNRTSTEITLSWKSMAEINGMGNGKVSRNFCTLIGLQYKVELTNYQVLGTILRQKLVHLIFSLFKLRLSSLLVLRQSYSVKKCLSEFIGLHYLDFVCSLISKAFV